MTIYYPRKCDHCNHVSNNPSSWHYHKRKHDPIPKGQLCDGGCGRFAISKNTNNKYYCEDSYSKCPQYLVDLSERTKKGWAENEWSDRREGVSKLMLDPEIAKKCITRANKTKREKFLAADWCESRKVYYRQVVTLTQENYITYKDMINPNNLPIGKTKYHVDHKVSKLVGWLEKIPPEILSHPENLCMMLYKDNCSKGPGCSITTEELLVRIKDSVVQL